MILPKHFIRVVLRWLLLALSELVQLVAHLVVLSDGLVEVTFERFDQLGLLSERVFILLHHGLVRSEEH